MGSEKLQYERRARLENKWSPFVAFLRLCMSECEYACMVKIKENKIA
jgi:hypothetical protein